MGEGLALLENCGGMVEIAEGLTVERVGEGTLGFLLLEACFCQGSAAAGTDAEAGTGADGEFTGIGKGAGFTGSEGLAIEGDC